LQSIDLDRIYTGGMKMKTNVLRLYVTGQTPRSKAAIAHMKRLCEEDLKDQISLEIIDVLEQPQLAEDQKILATPTLLKMVPPPLKRIIGDLSDKEKVLIGLDLALVKE
jgi:circadian clock protein KaiB